MDKIARIRQEIERRANYSNKLSKEAAKKNLRATMEANDLLVRQYNSLLLFLDTLSEELDKSLEEAAEEFAVRKWDGVTVDNDGPLYAQDEIEYAFKARAEWQKEQMMDEWLKDREGCFWDGVNEGKKAMYEQMKEEQI